MMIVVITLQAKRILFHFIEIRIKINAINDFQRSFMIILL